MTAKRQIRIPKTPQELDDQPKEETVVEHVLNVLSGLHNRPELVRIIREICSRYGLTAGPYSDQAISDLFYGDRR